MRSCALSCLALVLAGTVCAAEPTGLTLFANGATDMKIVLPVAATDAEKDAADELKQFLDRASGATFEIVAEDKSDTGLFVGRTDLAKRWGLPPLPPTPEQDEGFAIEVRSAEMRAAIVGTIDMATKFAVYDFLDLFVGVRWFLPGRLFEVVPKRDRLVISDCSINALPALSGRVLGYASSGAMYPDNDDPQLGTPLVDYSDPKGVRVDTSRRSEHASRWAVRNLLSMDGRLHGSFHGHNFIRIFNYASYFKEHPEYYPKRYSVEGAAPPGGYGWQPCTSEPGVLQVTLDWGRDFFRNNPEHWAWFSLGINDSGGWCGCERCLALHESQPYFRGHPNMTDRYLKFVKQVADVMLEEFPDRKIGLIAYNSVVVPPATIEKLPPNVVVLVTRDSFQYHDPEYLAVDLEADKRWLEVTNGNLYRYDYYSFGWLVPRYYPHRLAEDIRRMRDIGVKGIMVEDGPLWPTVGPSYYVVAKLWWDPDRDVDELIEEFHTTLFGPAAAPMARYWDRHEQIWLKKRPGKWFEGLGNMTTLASMFSGADLVYLDQQFAEARKLAGADELIQQRIGFFERGWEFVTHYIREHHLLGQLQAAKAPEGAAELAKRLLAAMQARHTFWAKFREEPRFPGQEKGPCEDYRFILEALKHLSEWEQKHQAALALVAPRIATQAPQIHKELLAHYRAANADAKLIQALESASALALAKETPNLVKNPTFELGDGNAHSNGIDWITKGTAQNWAHWKHITGSFSFADGIARIHGTNGGVWIQTFAVTPGEEIVGTVEYRLPADPPAKARLAIIWKDRTGAWLGAYTTVGFNADSLGRADDWQEAFCRQVVPAGAATAVFQFGAENLDPDTTVEFQKPYFGKIAAP